MNSVPSFAVKAANFKRRNLIGLRSDVIKGIYILGDNKTAVKI